MRIFGCLVRIHVPREKRLKLEPYRKKGTFVWYSETSKAYKIYIPCQRSIEISRDIIFDEDASFRKSRDVDVDEEHEAPQNVDTWPSEPVNPSKYQQDSEGTNNPMDSPRIIVLEIKKIHARLSNTL